MFPIYPGFENLELRVEVNWQGQTRSVVARLEQWPDSNQAILVCAFADEPSDGEWIFMKGSTPYRLERPDRMRYKKTSYCATKHQLSHSYHWKLEGRARLSEVVQRGFRGKRNRIARLLKLDEITQEPNLALWTLENCAWIKSQEHWDLTGFEQPATAFNFSESQARESLLEQWRDSDSEAHFAWKWSRWSERERLQRLSGIAPYFAQLESVMKLLLIASSPLHQQSPRWHWLFHPHSELLNFSPEVKEDQSASELRSDSHIYYGEYTPLQLWTPFLLRGFQPLWRQDWFDKHQCVSFAWNNKLQLYGESAVLTLPTAHEQLEAKLELRDWLADKAAPDVAAALLASLDD